jgi:hypothetical protein
MIGMWKKIEFQEYLIKTEVRPTFVMPLKILLLLLLLFVICTGNNSCSKSPSTPTPPVDTVTNPPKDIYVAGAIYGADHSTRAAYWKKRNIIYS